RQAVFSFFSIWRIYPLPVLKCSALLLLQGYGKVDSGQNFGLPGLVILTLTLTV
ncbi:hypothetical protein BgiBS90_034921, partial [Biomphalaria glabrata]